MTEMPAEGQSTQLSVPTAASNVTIKAPRAVPQNLGTGSATGNPRNKCALAPGHSLMDWIRLGNSGADLAGTGGRTLPVSSNELAKHNTRNDAWLAIRGKVYNVTRYMDFHPGGIDELMRGVGRDATKLFDEVHAWVNYQQLLAKCYIGPLRSVVKVDADLFKSEKLAEFTKPALPVPPAEVLPRFDWIQTQSEITVYIYTRQFCNPGFILQYKNVKKLLMHIQIDCKTHILELDLHDEIQWPPKSLKRNSELGKIEMSFAKCTKGLWSSYGSKTMTVQHPVVNASEQYFQYRINTITDMNHDSFEMSLESVNNETIICPAIGHHVSIATVIEGMQVNRNYTPIDECFVPNPSQVERKWDRLHFLIKSYSDGILSRYLKSLGHDACVEVSAPAGHIKIQKLLTHRRFAFLAAGSGITPFLNLIKHLLERSTSRIEHLHLMYFNKSEEDIWCRSVLERMQETDERLQVTNILSAPNADWPGQRGRVSAELLASIVDKKSSSGVTYIAVCGPTGFNRCVEELLKSLHFAAENVFIFQG